MVVRIAGERMYLWRAVDHEGEVLDMLVQHAVGDASSGHRIAKPLSPLRPLANCAWATISPTVGTLWKSPSTGRRPSSCLITKLPHCSMPVAIISTFRLPHSGHTSRARHSRTVVSKSPTTSQKRTRNTGAWRCCWPTARGWARKRQILSRNGDD
jgi:hypothetical protein